MYYYYYFTALRGEGKCRRFVHATCAADEHSN